MIRAILVAATLLASVLHAQESEPFRVEEALVPPIPSTLDPHAVFVPGWNRFFRLTYDTPLACDPESERLDIVPHLLAEMPTLSEDGLTLRLRFRDGVRFHDDPCFEGGRGRLLRARDFVDTILRHANPDTASPFWRPYFAGRIIGLDAVREQGIATRVWDADVDVEGLKVTGPLEVEMKLTRPYPQLISVMTMACFSIVPREAAQRYGSGLARHPVGTGPYRFDGDESNDERLIFHAVEDFWNAAAGGDRPLPRNAGVRIQAAPDLDLAARRFKLGDLSLFDVAADRIDGFVTVRGKPRRKAVPRGSSVLRTDSTTTHYIVFNFKNRILAKKKVRQALALALDRERYVKDYYNGFAVLADHPVPPALQTDIPELPWKYGERDLKLARKLLAEAGHADGEGLPEFIVDMPGDDVYTRTEAEILERSWRRLGVKIQVRHQDWNSFLSRVRSGVTEISVHFWFADYPDAENFMLMLHSSTMPRKGVNIDSPNAGFWKHDRYDDLYTKSTMLLPGEARGKLYREMIEIIQEECPWIFVAHQLSCSLLAPRVGGVGSRSYFSWDYAYVERTAPER